MSHEIALPTQFSVLEESATKGSFEIRGLFPGYGHTLGNSVRRVILSSLPGAAIVMVKIEGVSHEFSTFEGMKEDILRFCLNLQQVRLRLVGVSEATLSLSVTGPREVTARDIVHGPEVEIVNPDLHLCELTTKNAKLSVELTVMSGIGFVPKAVIHKDRVLVGTIVLDGVFTPIRKVSYDVENVRVGDRTDYNKLVVHIETDGTLEPKEAFESALKIMITQLRSVLNLSEADELLLTQAHQVSSSPFASAGSLVSSVDTGSLVEVEDDATADVLKTRVDSLELSTRTQNALIEANIRTLGGLVKKSESDILNIDGIGQKGVEEIKDALTANGLRLKA